jgi:LPS-assembly lipoprotein
MPQAIRRIRLLPALLVLALLQGCGWHLRGDLDLPPSISPLFIQGVARYDALRMELGRSLAGSGVEVAEQQNKAGAVLRILNHTSNKRVLSVIGSTGKVAEYELQEALEFDMVDARGQELFPPQRVEVLRSYTNREDEVLGKRREEETLRKEMRRDLASRMLNHMQANLK